MSERAFSGTLWQWVHAHRRPWHLVSAQEGRHCPSPHSFFYKRACPSCSPRKETENLHPFTQPSEASNDGFLSWLRMILKIRILNGLNIDELDLVVLKRLSDDGWVWPACQQLSVSTSSPLWPLLATAPPGTRQWPGKAVAHISELGFISLLGNMGPGNYPSSLGFATVLVTFFVKLT